MLSLYISQKVRLTITTFPDRFDLLISVKRSFVGICSHFSTTGGFQRGSTDHPGSISGRCATVCVLQSPLLDVMAVHYLEVRLNPAFVGESRQMTCSFGERQTCAYDETALGRFHGWRELGLLNVRLILRIYDVCLDRVTPMLSFMVIRPLRCNDMVSLPIPTYEQSLVCHDFSIYVWASPKDDRLLRGAIMWLLFDLRQRLSYLRASDRRFSSARRN